MKKREKQTSNSNIGFAVCKWTLLLVFVAVTVALCCFGIMTLRAVEYGGTGVLSGKYQTEYEKTEILAYDLAAKVADSVVLDYGKAILNAENTEGKAAFILNNVNDSPDKAKTYTYGYLYDYLESVNMSDAFFEEWNTPESQKNFKKSDGSLKTNSYMAVDRNFIIDLLKDYGQERGSKIFWTSGDLEWYYSPSEDEFYCSRFGHDKLEGTYYYNMDDYANYQSHPESMLKYPLFKEERLIAFYGQAYCTYRNLDEIQQQLQGEWHNWYYWVHISGVRKWSLLDGPVPSVLEQDANNLKYTYNFKTGESTFTGTAEQKRIMDNVLEVALGNTEDTVRYYRNSTGVYQYEHVSTESEEDSTAVKESLESWTGDVMQDNAYDYLVARDGYLTIILDADYPEADDFKKEKQLFDSNSYLLANGQKYFHSAIALAVLWVLLFLYLLFAIGYRDIKGTPTGGGITYCVPTELMLAVPFVVVGAVIVCLNDYQDLIEHLLNQGYLGYALSAAVVVVELTVLELISRLKNKKLLKKSILGWFINVCWNKILLKALKWCWKYLIVIPWNWTKKAMRIASDAIRRDIRMTLLFVGAQILLFVLTTLGLVLLAESSVPLLGILFYIWAFALDMMLIYYVFRHVSDTHKIMEGVKELDAGNLDYQIDAADMKGHNKELAGDINSLQEGLKLAVEQSLKDERLKAELITNVSHDIKTPLTSIINYVDLLKKEPMHTEDAVHYLEVLDQKSQRLKQLTEDLVEVSKASTGNMEMAPMHLDFIELIRQVLGEFEDKYTGRGLTVIEKYTIERAPVYLDSRRTYRIFENLCQNIYKYAMPNSRIYVEVSEENGKVVAVMKNISEMPLNVSADELTERFVRGDASRNTSGSGLGLSIAQNLTTLQDGEFKITLDGDLFKVTVIFALCEKEEKSEEE